MPAKAALVVLAVAGLTLAGCSNGEADPAPVGGAAPAASATASAAPADNGVAALEADAILEKAKAALADAKSFQATGSFVEDGDKTEIELKVNGKDFTGTMSFGKAEVELLSFGGKGYIRPNEAFWVMTTDAKQGKAMTELIGGRWISGADKDDSFKELLAIGDVDQLLDPSGKLSKGTEKEIDGVPAIGLKDAGDNDNELFVATTGEPYPLRIVGKAGEDMAFSGFGETFSEIAAPAADKVVDLDKIAGK